MVSMKSSPALISWLTIQSLFTSNEAKTFSSQISTRSKNPMISSSIIQQQQRQLLKNQKLYANHLTKPAFIIRGGGSSRGGDYDYSSGGDYGGSSNSGYYGNNGNDGYYQDDDNSYYGNENEKYNSDRRYDDYEDDRYGNSQRQSGGGGYESDYYGDRDDYKGRSAPSKQYSRSSSSPLSNLPNVGGILRNGNKKIGLSLLGAGLVFTMLGISLFFNKTLMRLGNLFFIAGVPMTIGPGRTTGYFLQPKKSRATGCLALGILLVFIGWPIFGIALEIFGVLNLFGNMFPFLMVILKQTPVVGSLLNGDNGGNRRKSSKNDRRANSRDRYSYDDEEDEYEEGGRYY